VIASTVDQIGSRLLIQGYGVSASMRPVYAGLAGNDILLLLDEVHLSQPFKQTLERLGRLRERFSEDGIPKRFHFAFLSATPGNIEGQRFGLQDTELALGSKLGPRLHAKKPTRLLEASGRDDLANKIAGHARALSSRHHLIGAIVNRVDTALQVFELLKRIADGKADVVLLTGRMRPLDRDDVVAENESRIFADKRVRSDEEQPLIVVGTQCIEAGADFDFDAMVTESASFDSLRQRFGRVNRLGNYVDAEGKSKAEGIIVHDVEANVAKRDRNGKVERKNGQPVMIDGDPIYGDTIVRTVKWLNSQVDISGRKAGKNRKRGQPETLRTVDFGTRSLLDAPNELLTPKAAAPALLPAYFDLWSQTAPEPFVVPEPSLFLHGPQRGPEDVNVIWRADVDERDFDSGELEDIVSAVAAVRPTSLEAVSLPFTIARQWLAGRTNATHEESDVEGQAQGSEDEEPLGTGRRALGWYGDKSEIVDALTLRPGQTLIVPVTYGGIDPASKSFNPNSGVEVHDLAERASFLARGRPVLRLHSPVLAGLGLDADQEDSTAVRRHLAATALNLKGWMRLWAQRIAGGRKTFAVALQRDAEGWTVILGEKVKPGHQGQSASGGSIPVRMEEQTDTTTDDEDSYYVGSEITLDRHTNNVESLVRGYARRLGISDALAADLSLAAW